MFHPHVGRFVRITKELYTKDGVFTKGHMFKILDADCKSSTRFYVKSVEGNYPYKCWIYHYDCVFVDPPETYYIVGIPFHLDDEGLLHIQDED